MPLVLMEIKTNPCVFCSREVKLEADWDRESAFIDFSVISWELPVPAEAPNELVWSSWENKEYENSL